MRISSDVVEFLHPATGPPDLQQVHPIISPQPEMSPGITGGVDPDSPFDLPGLLQFSRNSGKPGANSISVTFSAQCLNCDPMV